MARGYGAYISVILFCSTFELAGPVLNARTRFAASAIVQTLGPLLFLVGAIVSVKAGYLVSGPLLSRALSLLVVGFPVAASSFIGKPLGITADTLYRTVHFGVFATVIMVWSSLFSQADMVLMSYLRGDQAAGVYKCATTLASVVTFLAALVGFPLPPILAGLAGSSANEQISLVVRLVMRYLICLGIPLVVGGWVMAPALVRAFFGTAYLAAAFPFALLLLASFVPLLSAPINCLLYVNDGEKLLAKISGLSAAVSILGNLLLIPWLGLTGAAIASLASYLLGGALQLLWYRRRFLLSCGWRRYTRYLLAAVIMAVVVRQFLFWSATGIAACVGVAIVGAIAYFVAAFALGGIRRNELAQLRLLVFSAHSRSERAQAV